MHVKCTSCDGEGRKRWHRRVGGERVPHGFAGAWVHPPCSCDAKHKPPTTRAGQQKKRQKYTSPIVFTRTPQ